MQKWVKRAHKSTDRGNGPPVALGEENCLPHWNSRFGVTPESGPAGSQLAAATSTLDTKPNYKINALVYVFM
jgi:hypothetical protein